MGKNRKQVTRYLGIETQNNTDDKPYYTSNSFIIVGDCKPSKTFRSLSMRIRHKDGSIHDYTILKSELERVFLHTPEMGELIPAEIREYLNP